MKMKPRVFARSVYVDAEHPRSLADVLRALKTLMQEDRETVCVRLYRQRPKRSHQRWRRAMMRRAAEEMEVPEQWRRAQPAMRRSRAKSKGQLHHYRAWRRLRREVNHGNV